VFGVVETPPQAMIFASLFAATTAVLLSETAVALEQDIVGDVAFDDLCDNVGAEACHLHLMQLRAARGKTAAPINFNFNGEGAEMEKTVQSSEVNSDMHWPNWPQTGEWPVEVPWKFKVDTPVKILLWTAWGFLTDKSAHATPNCEFYGAGAINYKMGVIPDPHYDISSYDVIIFHMSNLAYEFPKYYTMPAQKPKGQIWVAACGEPYNRPQTGIDCHLMNDTKVMKDFDALSTFSTTSDFPAIQDPLVESAMRLPIPDFTSRGPELATIVFSDCHSSTRNAWVAEIMNSFKAKGHENALLSYGVCMNNAKEPSCVGAEQGGFPGKWVNRCASRPFKLVPENIEEAWYVTEKIWDALAEGSIPVYWGAAEVKLWLPAGSFLYAGDFPSVDALVERMLTFTEADFDAAYRWKTQPVSKWPGWQKAWKLSHYTLVPRLCEAAAHAKLNGGELLTPDKE